ncbi:MAG TPA: divalent-cation tolerance protein CutA [Acidobacteriaceae bacterium]|nr:divalent-cation tolerance protein CutA [Acidobacteriaceae bacterium]
MTDARILLTTFDDLEQAKQFARQLVEQRLAACVNLIENVHSTYRWQGKVEAASEILAIIKTTADRIETLKQAIARLHPYQLPELLVLTVSDGSETYLSWLFSEVGMQY